MYTYKTEILTVSTKWFSDKANAEDILMLDKLLTKDGNLQHTIIWQHPHR